MIALLIARLSALGEHLLAPPLYALQKLRQERNNFSRLPQKNKFDGFTGCYLTAKGQRYVSLFYCSRCTQPSASTPIHGPRFPVDLLVVASERFLPEDPWLRAQNHSSSVAGGARK